MTTFEALRRVPEDVKELLREKAREIQRQSLVEVPRRTGALAEACEIYETYKSGGWVVGVRYRPDVPNEETGAFTGKYMVKQHEYPWLDHPNGGKAKFLEDPYRRVLSTLLPSIKARIRWSLERRGPWSGYEEYRGTFKEY